MCVCVGAMKKFTSVSSFCSELRSIATITATMLPVSPFTEFRGVWECVCEQWLHPHTPTPPHTHWYGHPYTRTVAFSVRVQWQTQCSKGGQSSSANCMRWECATAVSDHASIAHFRPYSSFLPPSPFYFLDFFAPLQPPLVSSKNCSLQMTNFTFSCLPSQMCECVCYLHLVFCSCCEFHFVTLSPPFKNCLYCLTRSHSKFSHTDCSSCSR